MRCGPEPSRPMRRAVGRHRRARRRASRAARASRPSAARRAAGVDHGAAGGTAEVERRVGGARRARASSSAPSTRTIGGRARRGARVAACSSSASRRRAPESSTHVRDLVRGEVPVDRRDPEAGEHRAEHELDALDAVVHQAARGGSPGRRPASPRSQFARRRGAVGELAQLRRRVPSSSARPSGSRAARSKSIGRAR